MTADPPLPPTSSSSPIAVPAPATVDVVPAEGDEQVGLLPSPEGMKSKERNCGGGGGGGGEEPPYPLVRPTPVDRLLTAAVVDHEDDNDDDEVDGGLLEADVDATVDDGDGDEEWRQQLQDQGQQQQEGHETTAGVVVVDHPAAAADSFNQVARSEEDQQQQQQPNNHDDHGDDDDGDTDDFDVEPDSSSPPSSAAIPAARVGGALRCLREAFVPKSSSLSQEGHSDEGVGDEAKVSSLSDTTTAASSSMLMVELASPDHEEERGNHGDCTNLPAAVDHNKDNAKENRKPFPSFVKRSPLLPPTTAFFWGATKEYQVEAEPTEVPTSSFSEYDIDDDDPSSASSSHSCGSSNGRVSLRQLVDKDEGGGGEEAGVEMTVGQYLWRRRLDRWWYRPVAIPLKWRCRRRHDEKPEEEEAPRRNRKRTVRAAAATAAALLLLIIIVVTSARCGSGLCRVYPSSPNFAVSSSPDVGQEEEDEGETSNSTDTESISVLTSMPAPSFDATYTSPAPTPLPVLDAPTNSSPTPTAEPTAAEPPVATPVASGATSPAYLPPSAVYQTPEPTWPPNPELYAETDLYCYPPYMDRVHWTNVWAPSSSAPSSSDGGYIVEVKEGTYCGPGNNHFSSATANIFSDESDSDLLVLQYKMVNGRWEGSEVRLVLPDSLMPFKYGTYSFSIRNVTVLSDGGNTATGANSLSEDLVLGLFTWDDTERYDVHENWNHEVDVEISRWMDPSNADTQFVIQPPEVPHYHRFFSGPQNGTYEPGGQVYSFEWNPTRIRWTATKSGETYEYTTQMALEQNLPDRIQCLPANVEIRMNVWNVKGADIAPTGMADTDVAQVVIDGFSYEPSGVAGVDDGELCSKHCQCSGATSLCIESRCTAG
jgi:hypothetical protein